MSQFKHPSNWGKCPVGNGSGANFAGSVSPKMQDDYDDWRQQRDRADAKIDRDIYNSSPRRKLDQDDFERRVFAFWAEPVKTEAESDEMYQTRLRKEAEFYADYRQSGCNMHDKSGVVRVSAEVCNRRLELINRQRVWR